MPRYRAIWAESLARDVATPARAESRLPMSASAEE